MNDGTAHFVTLCAYRRQPIFGALTNGRVTLSPAGQLARDAWLALPGQLAGLRLDAFVFMPNHVHGLLWLPAQAALRAVLDGYRATLRAARVNGDRPVFQPSFHGRAVRRPAALASLRDYVRNNPADWARDPLNPAAEMVACAVPPPLSPL
ncbi:MAG: hypothetical protein R3300_17160 [Candidatus Promineifilaceae bacterium]|nr:hypothetical protein [Candidatus Promineifilaceae bacterium]